MGQNGLQREHYRSEITTSINNHFYMLGQAGPLCTASSGLLPLTEFDWSISGDQLVKTSVAFSLSTLVPSLTEIRLMSTAAYVNLKNMQMTVKDNLPVTSVTHRGVCHIPLATEPGRHMANVTFFFF